LAVLQDASDLATEQLAQSVATHLIDLVIVAAGGKPDAVALARERGVRAARLHAIKADIARNLVQRDLSAELVAARQGISPRYVRSLLEADGHSFSQFVTAQRLALAHQLLTDRRNFDRPVSEIAFEAGFGDLSYFNRCFRRRYAAKPSDVREDAKRRRGE
jgi:AraC-like DNA-binding protein